MSGKQHGLPCPRRWIFRILAPVLVVLLLAGAELGVRWSGVLEGDPAMVPAQWEKGYLVASSRDTRAMLEQYTDESSERPMVRTDRQLARDGYMRDLQFTRDPSPGRPRIFCLGGSATLGVPFERQPGVPFPDHLETLLRDQGVQAEVINLGGASFGSDQVLELGQAVLAFGPAALVVYSANNEFFNYHLELVELNRGWVRSRLEGLALLQGARLLLGLGDGDHDGQPGGMGDALQRRQHALVRDVVSDALRRGGSQALPAPAPDGVLERRDVHYLTVMRRYAANLGALKRAVLARPRPPVLLLVEVPVNLMWTPSLSLHSPDLGLLAARRHESSMSRGERQMREKDWPAAISSLQEAVQADAVFAASHNLLGRALLESKPVANVAMEPRDALRELESAVELDMDPGRPLRAQARTVRALADGKKIFAVDLEPSWYLRKDPRRGSFLFHDMCHLTREGYKLVARQVARALYGPLRTELSGGPP